MFDGKPSKAEGCPPENTPQPAGRRRHSVKIGLPGVGGLATVTVGDEPIRGIVRLSVDLQAGDVPTAALLLLQPEFDATIPAEDVLIEIPLGGKSVKIPLSRLLDWAEDGLPEPVAPRARAEWDGRPLPTVEEVQAIVWDRCAGLDGLTYQYPITNKYAETVNAVVRSYPHLMECRESLASVMDAIHPFHNEIKEAVGAKVGDRVDWAKVAKWIGAMLGAK